MKALITGAGGQVGRILCSDAPPGVEVLACGHKDLDISDAAAVSEYVRLHAPDVIINAAAYTAVDRAESEPELAKRVNAEGPRHLAAAAAGAAGAAPVAGTPGAAAAAVAAAALGATAAGAARAGAPSTPGIRLIHLSTDFVFDGAASVPYRPEAATNPLGVYGVTKLAGERAVLEQLPGRSVVLRTAWVYAAEGANFVRTMLRVMKANGTVRVVADQVGTPTAARALAETIWQLVAKPDVTGIHHWTDAGVASWYDFAVAIAEEGASLGLVPADVTVTPIATVEYPTPARRPSYSVLDKTSLTSLGLTPLHWRKRLRSVLGEMKVG